MKSICVNYPAVFDFLARFPNLSNPPRRGVTKCFLNPKRGVYSRVTYIFPKGIAAACLDSVFT